MLVVLGQQHNLSHVTRVMRHLPVDGLHHRVRFAADHDAAPSRMQSARRVTFRDDNPRAAKRTINDMLAPLNRKSTRLNSSHLGISYAVFCLKKKTKHRP